MRELKDAVNYEEVTIKFGSNALSAWDGVTSDGFDVFSSKIMRTSGDKCGEKAAASAASTHWSLLQHSCEGVLSLNLLPKVNLIKLGSKSMGTYLHFAYHH